MPTCVEDDRRTVIFASYLAQDNLGDEISDKYFMELILSILPQSSIKLLNLANGTAQNINLREWLKKISRNKTELSEILWFDFSVDNIYGKDLFFLANSGIPQEILCGILKYAKKTQNMLVIGAQIKQISSSLDKFINMMDLANFRDPIVSDAHSPYLNEYDAATEFDPVIAWYLDQRETLAPMTRDINVVFSIREGHRADIQAKSILRYLETHQVESFALYACSLSDSQSISRDAALQSLLSHPRHVATLGDGFLGSPHQVGLIAKVQAIRRARNFVTFGRLHAALIAAVEGVPLAVALPWHSLAARHYVTMKLEIFARLGVEPTLLVPDEDALRLTFAIPRVEAYVSKTRREAGRFKRGLEALIAASYSPPCAFTGEVAAGEPALRLASSGTSPLESAPSESRLTRAVQALRSLDRRNVTEPCVAAAFDGIVQAAAARIALTRQMARVSDAASVFARFAELVMEFSALAASTGVAERPWEGEARNHGGYALARLLDLPVPAQMAPVARVPDAFSPGTSGFSAMLLEAACNLAAIAERAVDALAER